MKTHDEIKKGQKACGSGSCCGCPYRDEGIAERTCCDMLASDTIEYIDQHETKDPDRAADRMSRDYAARMLTDCMQNISKINIDIQAVDENTAAVLLAASEICAMLCCIGNIIICQEEN